MAPNSSKGKRTIGVANLEGLGTMENSAIVLPTLKNGVISLGDLWDCRSSTAVGNLFDKPLTKDHLEAHPISVLNYNMQRVKKASDYVTEMHISVELGLECAGGAVQIKGKASFDREERQKFHQEKLLCNYDLTTYEVRTTEKAITFSSNGEDDVLSKRVVELLKDGTMVATHFVQAVTLGGQAQASITYYENLDKSHMNLFGSLEGTIKIGPVTATAKASLELLDSQQSEDINTEILIKAQPRLNSAPTTCEAMFEEVEKIDDAIENEQHFGQLDLPDDSSGVKGRRITGIPIRFRLVPLNRIPGLGGEDETYLLMKQEILDAFSKMLLTLEDYSYEDYLRQLLREDVPAIVPILQDDNHPLTQELSVLATAVMLDAQNLKRDAVQLFANYKYGLASEIELNEFLTRYSKEIPLIDIAYKLTELGRRGRQELADIRSSDVVHLVDGTGRPAVNFFTNSRDMIEWYSQERTIKLLLKTANQPNSNGIFQRLFAMSVSLKDSKGVEVGIAFPAISEDFSLSLKTTKTEIKIPAEELDFAIDLFRLATDTGAGDIFSLFFTLNCELSSVVVPLPLTVLNDFPIFMNIMSNYLPKNGNVFICETYCELLAQLVTTIDTLNFVFPIDACNRGPEMMKVLKKLRGLTVLENKIKHKWFFSKFGILSKNSAPLMFVFKDNNLSYICYDMLDIATLVHCLEEKEGFNWKPLEVSQGIKSSLYVDQWNYATEVVPKTVLEQFTFLSEPIGHHEAFPSNEDRKLQDALTVLRGLALRKDAQVITSIALMALRNFQLELEPLLMKHCKWADNAVPSTGFLDMDWTSLAQDTQYLLNTGQSYMTMVYSTLGELKKLRQPNHPRVSYNPVMHLKMNQMVSFLVNATEESELSPLKDEVIKYAWDPSEEDETEWSGRRDKIANAFEAFLINSSSDKANFHLNQLSQIADQISLQGSISINPYPLAKAFCDNVEIDETTYFAVRDTIDKYLLSGQFYQALSILDSIRVHPLLYVLQSELKQIQFLPAPINTKSILEKMVQYHFDLDQLQIVWENPKFLHLVRTSLDNKGVLDTLYILIATIGLGDDEDGPKFPIFIPQDVIDKVKPLFSRGISNGPSFPWIEQWNSDVSKFADQLKIFVARCTVPDNFQQIFSNNLNQSKKLEEILETYNALLYWDSKDTVFKHNWTAQAVQEALKRLQPHVAAKIDGALNTFKPVDISRVFSTTNYENKIKVVQKWYPVTIDGEMSLISYRKLTEINKVKLLPPQLSYGQLGMFCNTLFPYLLNNLRSHNLNVQEHSFLHNIVAYPIPGDSWGQINFGNGIHHASKRILFTRDDLWTAVFQTNDSIAAHQILQILLTHDNALPMIISNLSVDAIQKGYLSLINLIQSTITLRGISLFIKPFRFVLTLRVGDIAGPLLGRSSLLNQFLMQPQDIFNSMTNYGSNLGRSLSRDGYLEFIPLTQKVCESTFFWTEFSTKFGHLQNEPLLLGILHGDALKFDKHIYDYLASYVSSVVVFWNVDNWKSLKERKRHLNQLTVFKHSLDIVLYPDASIVEHVSDQNLIHKSAAISNDPGTVERLNAAKIRRIISEAFEFTFPDETQVISPKHSKIENLLITSASSSVTAESNQLLDVIQQNSVKKIKSAISLKDNPSLALEVFELFLKVLQLEEQSRYVGLHHLVFQLDHMNKISSSETREKIRELRDQIIDNDSDILKQKSLKQQIKVHMEELQLRILTLQNLFHSTGIYLFEDILERNQFCRILVECILAGFPIELEDTFSTDFDPLFQDMLMLFPKDIRVFCVSIIGLKDSGKSTLLNRLYGGTRGFSEFGCTKGILIKLLWVTDEIRKDLECDAFLLLDSEGVSAVENEEDALAEQKERKLVTFLLSKSDMTLINIRADNIRQLSSIIETSLFTLLKNGEDCDETFHIAPPDIQIIQMNDKESTNKTSDLFEAFSKSFSCVRDISKKTFDFGLTFQAADRLVQINSSSFRSNPIFTLPPYDESKSYFTGIERLRNLIQNKCIRSRSNIPGRLSLQDWFQQSITLWQQLQNVDAYNIPRTIKDATTDLNTFEQICDIKYAISKAFWAHEERIRVGFFDIELEHIFAADFTIGFDKLLEILLNRVSNELLQIPNVCESKSTQAKMGQRSGSVNPNSCEECQTAFALREQLFEDIKTSPDSHKSFLIIEEINSLTDQMRYQTFHRFNSVILGQQVKQRKSEHLSHLVKDLAQEEDNATVIYQKVLQNLSSSKFIPNSIEMFHSELQFVYRNLRKQILEKLGPFVTDLKKLNSKDFQNAAVFKVSPYYSESTYVIPIQNSRNRLTWDQAIWLRIQLTELPLKIIKEFGVGPLYKWGMAMQLRSRVEEILALLKQKMGRNLNTFQLQFVWLIHIAAAKAFSVTLAKEQQIWAEEYDPVQVFQMHKSEFIRDPTNYFQLYNIPSE